MSIHTEERKVTYDPGQVLVRAEMVVAGFSNLDMNGGYNGRGYTTIPVVVTGVEYVGHDSYFDAEERRNAMLEGVRSLRAISAYTMVNCVIGTELEAEFDSPPSGNHPTPYRLSIKLEREGQLRGRCTGWDKMEERGEKAVFRVRV